MSNCKLIHWHCDSNFSLLCDCVGAVMVPDCHCGGAQVRVISLGRGVLAQGTCPGSVMEEHMHSAYLDDITILNWHYSL